MMNLLTKGVMVVGGGIMILLVVMTLIRMAQNDSSEMLDLFADDFTNEFKEVAMEAYDKAGDLTKKQNEEADL